MTTRQLPLMVLLVMLPLAIVGALSVTTDGYSVGTAALGLLICMAIIVVPALLVYLVIRGGS